jgi:hypothetical protein
LITSFGRSIFRFKKHLIAFPVSYILKTECLMGSSRRHSFYTTF